MTPIQEIERIDRTFLWPSEVAKVLGVNPHSIRLQARENPALLGFPVMVCGSRTKIPKAGFLKFMEGVAR